ncbi:ribosome biogenesis GTPase Der [Candidatus Uhrbacteria bacterium]|nr:ribosome biogenesis GTPase Der [Candidatus Uhrbacteria bacterium]
MKKHKKSGIPFVSLVGRVNVGKSSLFNRLLGEKKALASPVPGTTRDVNYGVCYWRDCQMLLADTGGLMLNPETEIDKAIQQHAGSAVQRSALVLFLVDLESGMHPDDKRYVRLLRKMTKSPILLVGNKADSLSNRFDLFGKEWYSLGLDAPHAVSAQSGMGSGDLLDVICEMLPKVTPSEGTIHEPIKVAVIGRTNVGKSSIVNRILGEERVIVSASAHTTREPHDTLIQYTDTPLMLIDTVGIRRKSAVSSHIEREGVKRSIKNIRKADIVLLVVESTVTPSKQEKRLASIAVEAGSGILIIANKWDQIQGKTSKSILAYEHLFRDYFAFIDWAPIMFLSALTGQRVHTVLDRVMALQEQRVRVIEQTALDDFIAKARKRQPPQWIRGQKKPVIYGMEQADSCPPTFRLQVKERFSIQTNYIRYLERRLREVFGFIGTPIRIVTTQPKKEVFART